MSMQPSTPVIRLRTIDELVQAGLEGAGAAAPMLLNGGSGEEVTVRRNRAAFGRLALVPRVLRDVHVVSSATSFLGTPLAMPVMLAPVGPVALFHPEGSSAAARGAAGAGTIAFIGMSSSPAYSEAIAAAGQPQVFQVYVNGDRGWLTELVARVDEVGCLAICVTVDNPVPPRRDYSIVHGLDWKLEWDGVPPNLTGLTRDKVSRAGFSWSELEWLVGSCPLPVIVKGIAHAEDAKRAADIGVRAVYLSNHGGRSIDHGLSTIETLSSVVEAVDDRTEIVLDGGVMRGTDVCKAVALGARAVLIGKLQCWALAAGGADGVRKALDLLHAEIVSTMALAGCCSIEELSTDHVRPTFAV